MRDINRVLSLSIAIVFSQVAIAQSSEIMAAQKLLADADAQYASDCNTAENLLIKVLDTLKENTGPKTNCSLDVKQQYRYKALDKGYESLLADSEFRQMAEGLGQPAPNYADLETSNYTVSRPSFSLTSGGNSNPNSQPIKTVRGYKTIAPGDEQ